MNYRENIALIIMYILATVVGATYLITILITIGCAIQEDKETALMEKNCNGSAFVRNNSVYVCVKVKAEEIK